MSETKLDTILPSDKKLIDKWDLYYHLPYDKSWDISSYKKIMENIDSVEKLIAINESLPELIVKHCMLFVMKEGITPMWEDPKNRNGGCFSFKVNKPDAGQFWFKLGSLVLGGTLGKTQEIDSKICGISMSPKRNYCILRVWVQSHDHNNINLYNLDAPSYSQIMYKSHNENTDFDTKEPVVPKEREREKPKFRKN
jgi:hypothetical protein